MTISQELLLTEEFSQKTIYVKSDSKWKIFKIKVYYEKVYASVLSAVK